MDREHGFSCWRPGRAVPVADAIEMLLDELQELYEEDAPVAADPRPLATGLAPLDRVLGGGLRRGVVTVLQSELAAQGRAVGLSVARTIDHQTVLDAPSVTQSVSWLLAGFAAVPNILLHTGKMTENDWAAIARTISSLAARPLQLSSVSSLRVLKRLAQTKPVDVLIVEAGERFDQGDLLIPIVAELAASTGVAILLTGIEGDHLPESMLERVVTVSMIPYDLAGRATLVRPDESELLCAAHVEVECITGVVRACRAWGDI